MHTNYTKVPSATIVHSFIEQVLLEYVLCARHYSRLWEFDVGKKTCVPHPINSAKWISRGEPNIHCKL